MPNATRTEEDSLGRVELPAGSLWGVHTQRAIENFPITGIRLSLFPEFIRALAWVKKAAARANRDLDVLTAGKAAAIEAVCDEIISGAHHDAFRVDMIQGGAGTSTNMNANEVIANLALIRMGRAPGDYAQLHPNDDVNRSQSTNDVYPTAMRLAIVSQCADFQAAQRRLVATLQDRATAFAGVRKIGRTQLQDAVPMTLGQEFEAFAVMLGEDIDRIREINLLLCEVNLGGTAIGTGINTHPDYARLAVRHLAEISGKPIVSASNLVEATSDMGAFVLFSGILKRLAVKLSKVANDLRLLSSGPRTGFGEIHLPPMQPGSSIMPGKVNPVIPEAVNQVAYQVIGNDLAVTMAAEAGQLQLNAMEPLIVYNLLNSTKMLASACTLLEERCIRGIRADREQCAQHVERSIGVITALVPHIGYANSSRIAAQALHSGATVRELVIGEGLLSEAELDRLLSPQSMLAPQGSAR